MKCETAASLQIRRCTDAADRLGAELARHDLRGEAEDADVLPDVLAVEKLREGQVGTGGGGRL